MNIQFPWSIFKQMLVWIKTLLCPQDGSISMTIKTQTSTCQVGVANLIRIQCQATELFIWSHLPVFVSWSPLLRPASWHQHWGVCPADVQVWHCDEGPCDRRVQGQTVQGQRRKPEGRRPLLLPQGKHVKLLDLFCYSQSPTLNS